MTTRRQLQTSTAEIGIAVGGGGLRLSSDRAKVQADISFLQERIALMHAQHNPNQSVLQTYQAMLARRETALAMLLRQR